MGVKASCNLKRVHKSQLPFYQVAPESTDPWVTPHVKGREKRSDNTGSQAGAQPGWLSHELGCIGPFFLWGSLLPSNSRWSSSVISLTGDPTDLICLTYSSNSPSQEPLRGQYSKDCLKANCCVHICGVEGRGRKDPQGKNMMGTVVPTVWVYKVGDI